jgi:protein gp37
MADRTKIEWTDATWNPIRGCTRVSEGCRHCYAEGMAGRFSDPGQWGHGLAQRVALPGGGTDHRWTGKVELVDTALDLPLRWRRPRRIFVNSTSDLFHDAVPDEWIDRVFAVMALAPQHTFQVLTKRPERMRAYACAADVAERVWLQTSDVADHLKLWALAAHGAVWGGETPWPLRNVWLGTSIEDRATADERIPHLLATPAAVRFISAEPLLGPVDLTGIAIPRPDLRASVILDVLNGTGGLVRGGPGRIDWVICGGESGPGARPMHPAWARSLRAQCQAAGVPFFFKQWGEWAPDTGPLHASDPIMDGKVACAVWNGQGWDHHRNCYGPPTTTTDIEWMYRLGKKRAGRLLDGREWNEVPNG